MGAITTEDVAIAELVVYIPTIIAAIWVVFRHGFHKQLGWIYLAIFSGIRIVGSILEIVSTKNKSDTNAEEWALILQSVGLSPLLLATLGLLKRVFDEVSQHVPSSGKNVLLSNIAQSRGIAGKLTGIYTKRATATSRRSRAVQILHIPALIALILAISGGTDEASSNVSSHAGGLTKVRVSVIMFLFIFLAAVLLWTITLADFRSMRSGQTRIYLSVMAALPLIAVRLLYSLIADFGHNPQFNLVTGDEGIRLGMATVEEFLVVIIYTLCGVFTPKFEPRDTASGDVEQTQGYAPSYQIPQGQETYTAPQQQPQAYAQPQQPQPYAQPQYSQPQYQSRREARRERRDERRGRN